MSIKTLSHFRTRKEYKNGSNITEEIIVYSDLLAFLFIRLNGPTVLSIMYM